MQFEMVCRTGPGMRQVVGFVSQSTGRGNFGGEFGHPIVTNGDLCRGKVVAWQILRTACTSGGKACMPSAWCD